MSANSPLVILDRDGVINQDSDAYIKSPDEWHPIEGSAAAIARLNRAGYRVVVATNQSGVGRGYYDLATLEAIHEKMCAHLATHDATLDGIFFCPHTPEDHCRCRKPAPGLLEQIAAHFQHDLTGVPMVGDSARDLEAGQAHHCRLILVETGKGKRTLAKGLPVTLTQVEIYPDLAHFVDKLLATS